MPAAPPYRTTLHPLSDPSLRTAWEALLAQSPQATAYSHLAFGAAVENALGLPARVAAVWEDDTLRAGVLLFEKRRGPFRAAALPPLVPYATPLLDAPLREPDVHYRRSALDALLALIADEFDQASLVLHPSLADGRALQWAGWQVEPAYTYRLDLRDRPSATAGWSSTPKHTLKSKADHYTVHEGADGIADAVALVEASHERQEHGLGVSPEAVRTLASVLVDAGLLRVFVARRGAEAEAGVFVLSDGRTAHYWVAGSAPGPAMTVLVGHVLGQLGDDGVAYFDFVGANTPSIAEFKRKFGSTLVPYLRARHTVHPALRLLDRLRQ